ncbi:MAG: hypothetical protein HYU37_14565 [Acidobacteria bacterium]|nr:hypothetical protein [Acidobacteriota bacterium]
MRLSTLVAAAFVLCLSVPSFAQEWIEYVSREDLFTVNFPDQPTVRDVTYPTEYEITLPGRVHSSEHGASRYSVTVVDYSNVRQIHAKRLENCDKYPNLCNNPYVGELRGAMDYAAYAFLKRAAKVLHYAYYNSDRIEGRRLQLANPDGTQTFAAIHMHENRLYILEGTVPANYPPPGHFQQSLGFIDAQGIRVRYESIYSNMYPPPPRIQYQVPQPQAGR